LIVKTPGSRGMIIQYPSVKTRYSSIPFCEVIPIFYFFNLGSACSKGL
jgi:hypothetical protein